MARYAYVVAANARYLPGLIGVLNSLDAVNTRGNKHPNNIEVIVLGYKLPQGFIDRLDDYNFQIIYMPVTDQECEKFGEGEILMRKRYTIPKLLGAQYDSYCILDADMLIMNDLERYFEIAAKTDLVLGCTLEQKRRYDDPNHQFPVGSGKYIIDVEFWNGRDLCCAPLFVGKRWYPALQRSWDIFAQEERNQRFKAPDMDALNICLLAAGS
jgi:lipopolysaccharide biosynthesis glycosyltransferase